MAHKKGQGSTSNGRDSIGKRLGVKKYAGEKVAPGNIIVRQRGTTFHAGEGVKCGSDYTLFAVSEGLVKFHSRKNRKYVSVVA